MFNMSCLHPSWYVLWCGGCYDTENNVISCKCDAYQYLLCCYCIYLTSHAESGISSSPCTDISIKILQRTSLLFTRGWCLNFSLEIIVFYIRGWGSVTVSQWPSWYWSVSTVKCWLTLLHLSTTLCYIWRSWAVN